MTKISRYPENNNIIQPQKFQLVFTRLPQVTFYCQSINLPGVRSDSPMQETSFVSIPRAGNKLQYEDLLIEFIVDEDLRNWFEIHDWIRGLAPAETFNEYTDLTTEKKDFGGAGIRSDATLNILTNSNNAKLRVKLHNLVPFALGGINFMSTDEVGSPVVAAANFRFTHFDIERV